MSKRTPLKDRPVVFLDTETTGLDEMKHEIIEIALVGSDGETILHTAVKPEHIETASPRALEVNGYNPGEWEPSPLWEDIAEKVHRELQEVIVVGQNVSFDMRFVHRSLERYFVAKGLSPDEVDEELGKIGYHKIDTVTLAWEHLAHVGIRSLSQWAICDVLGIVNPGEHSALHDIRTTMKVYKTLIRANGFQRWWWGVVGPGRIERAMARRKAAREAAETA